MGWVCTKAMRVCIDGKYIDLLGNNEPVPAEDWLNKGALQRFHYIRFDDTDNSVNTAPPIVSPEKVSYPTFDLTEMVKKMKAGKKKV